MFKWGISIANLADSAKPQEKVSYPQQIAVTATGVIWSRYITIINPEKNLQTESLITENGSESEIQNVTAGNANGNEMNEVEAKFPAAGSEFMNVIFENGRENCLTGTTKVFKENDEVESIKEVHVDSEKTNSKRSRKKKTLAELKNEEKLLLNERSDLKREMAVLRLYMETQRATNDNLKRIKVELQPCLDKQLESTFAAEESTSDQLQPEATAHHIPTAVLQSDIAQESLTSSACLEAKTDAKFVLPDLNVPFDEPGCDVI
ncbi:Mitochondrial pyruvate carrier 4 [Striga hermonthica]|uniref:Mitochondrial pyruvate carrier n=1 Tax=Striga hermonthica TaxID=68872 RepID=A0A9N7MZA7_STRHE|nr:Mitochondrial pyruvate carrier 4 [Striga hermonthica]